MVARERVGVHALRVSAVIRAPLSIELSPREMQEIDERWRDAVRALQSLAQRDLWYWSSFEPELPTTAFREAKQLVGLTELFRAPTADELEAVARGPDQKLRRLSPAQLAEIREEAHFSVASVRYEGQRHVWALTALLQRGRGPIGRALRRSAAFCARQFIVESRDRLFREKSVSLIAGARRMRRAARGLAGLAVGLVEQAPKHEGWDVDERLRAARRAYVLEGCARVDAGCWRTSDGLVLDLRLHEPSLSHKMMSALERVFARSLREDREQFYQRIAADEAIEELAPGLGAALVEHARARDVVAEIERLSSAAIDLKRTALREALARAHPTRALIDEWVSEQVARGLDAWEREEREAVPARAHAELVARGLDREAWIFSRGMRFAREVEPGLRAGLESARVPAGRFEWPRRIWRRANWKVTRHEPEGAAPYYTLDRHARPAVTTDAVGWRLSNLWHRSACAWNNGLHWLLSDNLLNGALGLRALFSREPFHRGWDVDAQTGALVQVGLTPTYRSRVRALWQGVAASRRAFEARPDTGFVGKSVSRWISRFWNYVLKGAVGTALIAVGQPALTAVNLAAVSLLTATSMLWAPLSGALRYALDALVYDRFAWHSSDRALPIAQQLIVNFGLAGVGQCALALCLGLAVHPTVGTVALALAGVRAGVRALYDDAARAVIIGPLGRVPVTGGFLARRVEGPGVSADYFFQVRPSLVSMVLRAKMETEELQLFQRKTQEKICAPQIELGRFVSQVLGPFSAGAVASERAAARVDESTARHLEALSRALAPRFEALSALTSIAEAAHIRLTRADLDATVARAGSEVKEFYSERILPKMTEVEREDLWRERALAVGDFDGLARRLLAETFSEGLLSPLEETDRSLRLVVDHLRASDYLGALEQGRAVADDLDRVREPYRSTSWISTDETQTPSAPSALFCERPGGCAEWLHLPPEPERETG